MMLNARLIKYAPPVKLAAPLERRSVVGEMGFRLFVRMAEAKSPQSTRPDELMSLHTEAEQYVLSFVPESYHAQFRRLAETKSEVECAIAEARSLFTFFEPDIAAGRISVSPEFRGCGIVDSCKGDVLAAGALFEVKSRLGAFEQADLRQAIVYSTLSFIEDPSRISRIGLLNPHRGLCFVASLDEIASDFAGLSVREFFNSIIELMTPTTPDVE